MKQVLYYAIVLIIWIIVIITWIIWNFPIPFLVVILIHVIESIFIGISTGRRIDSGTGKSLAMCMVFGVAWWFPLVRKMKAETFTDADFLRKN